MPYIAMHGIGMTREKFDPSRFDEDGSRSTDELMRSTAYTPFSSGPRVCIGRHFAMLEMVVILCKILQKYKVSIPVPTMSIKLQRT